jgi:hypothetical protein
MKTLSLCSRGARHLALAIVLLGSALLSVAETPLNSDLPPRNSYLADSVLSVFHVNSGQTGASPIPGPVSKTRQIKDADIIWKKIGPGDGYSIQYSGVYPNGKRVGWFGGSQQLLKLDADTLDTISIYVLNKGKFYSPEEIERLIAKADKLKGQAMLDVLVPVMSKGIELGVQSGYRLLDKDNNLFILYSDRETGGQTIRKFGDAIDNDPDSDIVLKGEFKLPADPGERFLAVAMNITYDGTLIVATRDGTLFAVSRDFRLLDKIRLPGREGDAKEFMNSFVRNSIAVDQQGGIYLVTRAFIQRVQWTGSKFSVNEVDGAWAESYPAGERGSGTTPALVGWHDGQDKMVVIGDGIGNVMVFWRDRIPDDWKSLDGQSHRVASVLPMNFGTDTKIKIKLENALVTMGNGLFVANDTPDKEVPWQGSYLTTSVAERYIGQTGGTEIKGGIKWEWNPKTRKLDVDWTTPLALVSSICTPAVNGLLYCLGLRNGVTTIEALDWNSGKEVFHYLLGKSYRYSIMGGLIDIAPNGEIECGCAGGFGVFRVHENTNKK